RDARHGGLRGAGAAQARGGRGRRGVDRRRRLEPGPAPPRGDAPRDHPGGRAERAGAGPCAASGARTVIGALLALALALTLGWPLARALDRGTPLPARVATGLALGVSLASAGAYALFVLGLLHPLGFVALAALALGVGRSLARRADPAP